MSESLNSIALFNGLSNDQLDKVAKLVEEVDYYNREKIFKDGDEARFLWFVREGRVDLRFDLPSRETSQECTVSTIFKDGALGWSALVKPNQYRLSAYCAADFVALSKIEGNALVGLMQKDPQIGYVIMSNLSQVIAKRFHDMQEEVATQAGHNIMNNW